MRSHELGTIFFSLRPKTEGKPAIFSARFPPTKASTRARLSPEGIIRLLGVRRCGPFSNQMKTTDCELGISKRRRQRMFLHISTSSILTI